MKFQNLFDEFYKYVTDNIIPFFSKNMSKKFEIYYYELNSWNKIFNLISIKNVEELIYRHFCDSLYSAKLINIILNEEKSIFYKSLKILDLGSGAGFPGIPVKIVLPNIKLTLVESVEKKCKFLKNINNKLGLNIEILNKRGEEIGQNLLYRQSYDFVLSRAVSGFSTNLEISTPLLKVNGYFLIHKTKKAICNIKDISDSLKNVLECLSINLKKTIFYTLPNKNSEFCILAFKKYKDTPKNFPRRTGIPNKRPL
ncbi:MAG: 16S rRNA (guanine(527)-N(7))-methyltransferase RsmG [Endomicrobium sp.]|jgi:16S rRNA (guanine527-N7)-methyltransferase|nr:16S rRNA (guanine(527)-N(7))-methyltransferase RsmG [Endomicrobium sp.]